MSSILDPVVGQPHLARDIIQMFVAGILNADTTPAFTDGVPDASVAGPALVALFPYYMEDKPDSAGVVRVADKNPVADTPVKTVGVTLALRMGQTATAAAQQRALAASEAVMQWLRPSGRLRTYQTLPSGRLARIFANPLMTPQGEDASRRFTVNLTFDLTYLDINVP